MLKSDPYNYLICNYEIILVLINSWISPVGSTTKGHEGANIKWNMDSHKTDSVIIPEC